MDAATAQNAAPIIQYASLPPGIGLIVEPLPDSIRITKPPVRSFAFVLLVLLLLISPVALLLFTPTLSRRERGVRDDVR